MKPTVSIICVTYNQEKYIAQALEGFLAQETDFMFELIVHDDASTDDTVKIIDKYIKNNKNLNCVFRPLYESVNQYSKGTYSFINDLFRTAQGRYIAYCEGDDYWTDPKKLQKQVDFMESHSDYAVCFHPVRVFFENNENPDYIFPKLENKKDFNLKTLLKDNYIQTNSVMYRRQKYSNMATTIMPQDWYLHLYHAQYGKIGFIDDVMADYRRHVGGVYWAAFSDSRSFWGKNAPVKLNFFREILDMYGDSKAYKAIILENAKKTVEIIAASNGLNSDLIIEYPELILQALTAIAEKDKIILDMNNQLLAVKEQLCKTQDDVDILRQVSQSQSIELEKLKHSNSYKLGHKLLAAPRLIKRLIK